GLAMDDRDGRAPVALARYPPIAQAVGRRSLAPSAGLCPPDDLGGRLLGGKAVEEAGVDRDAIHRFGLADDRLARFFHARRDDALDWQVLFRLEFLFSLYGCGPR